MNIRGFGPHLVGKLVSWRKSLEHKFVFHPTNIITSANITGINPEVTSRCKQIESYLLAGPNQLHQIKNHILQQRKQLISQLEQAHYEVKQAKASLDILKS
ncbi:hypothetical protein TI05_05250 [Achromatium sp. WMS3]|nr:hypothetical protein TI05_05250 [Achromatium sp. WMS3]